MSLIIGHTVYNTGNNETSYFWKSVGLMSMCCESAIHVCWLDCLVRNEFAGSLMGGICIKLNGRLLRVKEAGFASFGQYESAMADL